MDPLNTKHTQGNNPSKEEKPALTPENIAVAKKILQEMDKPTFHQYLDKGRVGHIVHTALFLFSKRIYLFIFKQDAVTIAFRHVKHTPSSSNFTPPTKNTPSSPSSPTPSSPINHGEIPSSPLNDQAAELLKNTFNHDLASWVVERLLLQSNHPNFPKLAQLPQIEPQSDGRTKITLNFDREGFMNTAKTIEKKEMQDLMGQWFPPLQLGFAMQTLKKFTQGRKAKCNQTVEITWNSRAQEIEFNNQGFWSEDSKGNTGIVVTKIGFKNGKFIFEKRNVNQPNFIFKSIMSIVDKQNVWAKEDLEKLLPLLVWE